MTRASLISASEDVLHQGLALLNSIDEESYSYNGYGPSSSSIGAHYRHVLDHFLCLVEGLRDFHIDYDRRSRNWQIENSIEVARHATRELLTALRAISDDALQHECTVVYSVHYSDRNLQPVRSAVAREVMFCVGHAIHHYAIVKLLSSLRTVVLPGEFGVAPSTLKYHQAQAAR
jgi:hypothetical protein